MREHCGILLHDILTVSAVDSLTYKEHLTKQSFCCTSHCCLHAWIYTCMHLVCVFPCFAAACTLTVLQTLLCKFVGTEVCLTSSVAVELGVVLLRQVRRCGNTENNTSACPGLLWWFDKIKCPAAAKGTFQLQTGPTSGQESCHCNSLHK
jgi:hypothetical protein